MQHADVIVIGGGLHGISSAFQLARRGLKVILLEAQTCGRHASGVNAGGVRTLGRDLAEVPLALASRTMWHQLSELLDVDTSFVRSGQLQVAENEAELEVLRKEVASLEALGYTHEELLDGHQVRELVPAISSHVVGGIWVRDDGHAVPYRVLTAFRLAAQRLGVNIHEDARVDCIEYTSNHWSVTSGSRCFTASHLVNAAGAWAGALAAQARDYVPLEPVGLMLMITHRTPAFIGPVLGATGRPLSFKQFPNGTVLIGGELRCAVDMKGGYGEIDESVLPRSARTVIDLFPHLKALSINRTWAGIEAYTPDGIPVLGKSLGAPNLVHAFGFSGHGFQLGPICGQIVAELVTEGRSTQPIEAFAVDRF